MKHKDHTMPVSHGVDTAVRLSTSPHTQTPPSLSLLTLRERAGSVLCSLLFVEDLDLDVCSRVFDQSPCSSTGLATSEDVPRLRLRLRVRVRVRVRLKFPSVLSAPFSLLEASGLFLRMTIAFFHLEKSKKSKKKEDDKEEEDENEDEKEKEEETSHLKRADPQLKLIP